MPLAPRPTALSLVPLLAVLLTAPYAAAAPCRPLLADPAGDATFTGADQVDQRVEDGRVVDLLSADLRSDRRVLSVVMRVRGHNPEGGTSTLDHAWEVSFSTTTAGGSERYLVVASRLRVGGDGFFLARVVAGNDVPEDEEVAGASAAEGVATDVTGAIDDVKGLVRMQVPVEAFGEWGGLGRELTRVRAVTWTGSGARAAQTGAATYGSADFGSTRAAYRVGARGCP